LSLYSSYTFSCIILFLFRASVELPLSRAFIEYCFDSKKKVTCRSPLSTTLIIYNNHDKRSQDIKTFIINALENLQSLRLVFRSKCLYQRYVVLASYPPLHPNTNRFSQPSPRSPSAHPSRLNRSTTLPPHPQNFSCIFSPSYRPPHCTPSLKPHITSTPSSARTQQQYATTQS
jgi:hypothetical protein